MDDQTRIPDLTPETPPKRLMRSSDNRMLLGVCGGLGDYFDVDATLVRVVFAIGALAFGSTILVYIVLAFVMPSAEMAEVHPREAAKGTVDEAVDEVKSGLNWIRDNNPFKKKDASSSTMTSSTSTMGTTSTTTQSSPPATGTMTTPPTTTSGMTPPPEPSAASEQREPEPPGE